MRETYVVSPSSKEGGLAISRRVGQRPSKSGSRDIAACIHYLSRGETKRIGSIGLT
jgi:hypothetical protein